MLCCHVDHGIAYYGDRVYVFAGKETVTAEFFDIESNDWAQLPNVPQQLCDNAFDQPPSISAVTYKNTILLKGFLSSYIYEFSPSRHEY